MKDLKKNNELLAL